MGTTDASVGRQLGLGEWVFDGARRGHVPRESNVEISKEQIARAAQAEKEAAHKTKDEKAVK